ncbi:MAG: molecular chaperone Hsp33 [Halieaceae bacterium]|jgi:molecular chaperone Hsp33
MQPPASSARLQYTGAMQKDTTFKPTPADAKRRFLFEHLDLRGELLHLNSVLGDIRAIHDYPAGVGRLIGEFLAASVLLASTLKFRGSLTVQARSDRQIPLIMAECNSELDVRAIARGAQQAIAESFDELLGGGQLTLTVAPAKGQRYQGIVALHEHSLAASIDTYFSQSEQLGTRLFLTSDGERAAGLLLQQLPMQLEKEPQQRLEDWQRISLLASTLTPAELLAASDMALLRRLFQEDTLRLFDAESVRFNCSCSRERTLAALSTLGEPEIRSILLEQGVITMDCEFCNQRYGFAEDDLAHLLKRPEGDPVH